MGLWVSDTVGSAGKYARALTLISQESLTRRPLNLPWLAGPSRPKNRKPRSGPIGKAG